MIFYTKTYFLGKNVKERFSTAIVELTGDPEELFEQLGAECETEASTLSGWVMEQTERVPAPGDAFDYQGWHVVVLKTDGCHVQEMELTRL